MKTYLILVMTFAFSSITHGSAIYISGNRVQLAIEAIHGVGNTGVGAKNQSCLLCHTSSSGGPGNLNGSFGSDFSAASVRVIGTTGGDQLPPTGANSLESIFSESTFAGLDSDGDGDSNATEFAANTDPADDVSEASSSGGDSGGCGMISPINKGSKFPPASLLLILLPFAALFSRRRTV